MPDPYRLLNVSTPLGADAFILTGVTGREELSRPFSFALEMVADTATAVTPDALVGKPVGWTITYPNTVVRQFHGVVRRLAAGEFIGRSKRVYRAEVVPWLWFLTRTADCKIFQKKTAPEIIEAVFGAFGFSDFKKSLTGTYAAREYCVQYRETAFAFVSRLMEEEGIFYFFEYAADKHTLVLADATSAYFDCDPHKEPEYRPEYPDSEAVHAWERRFEYRSGKYTHTDYNFETPSTNLLKSTDSTVSLQKIASFELFDYPGLYPVTGRGQALGKVRIEQDEAGYETAAGTSRCNSFVPGGKFALSGHLTDTAAVVVTAVEHAATEPLTAGVRGGGGSYQNRFTAIPAAVPFRPERLTRRPVVEGPQTAVVVGPAGEEIYTDKYGRIKVHFHWDRVGQKNENDTCWMRVGELWAGKNWGMVFTPRIGQEVVVDFLEGDPDQPIVTGRVYNAEHMPPYALPANMTQSGVKTRSTKGGGTDDFNELRFEDKKGGEEIYFHAQKDFVRLVENNDKLTVGSSDTKTCPDGSQTISIYKDRTTTIETGNETLTVQKGDQTVTVSKGKDTLLVSMGDRSVTVDKGNEIHTVTQGNLTVMVGGVLGITAKSGMTVAVTKGGLATTVDQGGAKFTVKEGGNQITVEQGGNETTIKAGDNKTTVSTGNDTYTVSQGNREVVVSTGNDTHSIKTGNREVTIDAGNDTLTIKSGNQTIKLSAGASTTEAMQSITLKVGSNSIVIDQSGVTIKGINVTIEGTAQIKASAPMVEVAGSAMTKISGGVVMIN